MVADAKLEVLLDELIAAQTEEEVTQIIATHPVLSNPSNWRPYGGPQAAGIFFGQQANPTAALADKVVNCIDARLTRECLRRGIDPEGPDTPPTMAEAVEKFFKVTAGDFSEVSERRRRELAESIVLAADGTRERPNIMVVDAGEGQHPDDFDNTFLSLMTGNKQRIPFVQGQFNMGGTGVLRYAGSEGYQLILSRRAPELLNGKEDCWGFTLMRHHPARPGEKSSYWEYCLGDAGSVLRVAPRALDLLPDGALHYGTVIKLWNYQLPPSAKTNITLDLWRELNRRLWAPALPVLVWEKRDYRGHSPTKLLLGNRVRIQVDDRDWLDGPPISIHATLGPLGMRHIEVSVFKVGYRKSDYASQDEAILFTVNGQTQASLGRTFLRSPTRANLGYLADYVLVHVDCTDVDTAVRERIFMASRDRMEDGPGRKEIEEALAEALSQHEELRRLDEARRLHGLANKTSDQRVMEVINRVLAGNRQLLEYLRAGGRFVTRDEPGDAPVEKFDGSYIPTYLSFSSKARGDQERTKQIPANSFARIRLNTDAQDDYLHRPINGGELSASPDIVERYHLFSGKLTLKILPPADAKPGDTTLLTVSLTRPDDAPLAVKLNVEITPPSPPHAGGPSGKPQGPKGKDLGAPKPWLVYREQADGSKTWSEMDPPWTEDNICEVKGDALDVYINMDAGLLAGFLRRHRRLPANSQDSVREVWKLGIYFCSLALYRDLAKYEHEDLFYDAIGAVAKVLLEAFYGQTLLQPRPTES